MSSSKRRTPRAAGSQRTATLVPWLIHFFRRHPDEDPAETVPARDFLDRCPPAVAAKLIAIVKAVAEAPPPAFSGGGKWEAMHGDMKGFYEVRADGPKRRHYRLFCLLERDGAKVGLSGPSLVLLAGKDKGFQTVLSDRDYAEVRRLGREFMARTPRNIAR
jgi:hypothetical protein